jgi:transposase
MIDMVRRHEIQVLRRAGHSLAETAKLVGVSQSSVQRVEAEASVSSFDSEGERERRRIGRPSKAEPFRSFLVGELMAQPDVLAVELLRRARNTGYAGGKSALYTLVKELRPERPRPIVRFEGLPGEFSQHGLGVKAEARRRSVTAAAQQRRCDGRSVTAAMPVRRQNAAAHAASSRSSAAIRMVASSAPAYRRGPPPSMRASRSVLPNP